MVHFKVVFKKNMTFVLLLLLLIETYPIEIEIMATYLIEIFQLFSTQSLYLFFLQLQYSVSPILSVQFDGLIPWLCGSKI